jgi:hypothetical protein
MEAPQAGKARGALALGPPAPGKCGRVKFLPLAGCT